MSSLMIFLQSMKLLYSRCMCNSDLVFRSTSIRVSISTIILLLTRRSSCSSSGGGIVSVNAPVTCLQNMKQQLVFSANNSQIIQSFLVTKRGFKIWCELVSGQIKLLAHQTVCTLTTETFFSLNCVAKQVNSFVFVNSYTRSE